MWVSVNVLVSPLWLTPAGAHNEPFWHTLLNPHRDAPGRVTAFRLAFVGADNYLRGVVV